MTSATASSSEHHYELIVIGAGPIGEVLAQAVAAEGMGTAIVEHDLVGGDCAYYACKPSKALLHPIQVAHESQHLGGVQSASVVADDLLARRNAQVSHYDDSAQKQALEESGVTVVRGHGRLTGEKSVEVHASDGSTRSLQAERAVVITTGTAPNIPPVFEGIPVWDSQDATAVQDVPPRLIIIGGGPVACEAASWMSALGSKVTMLIREGSLLTGFEPFVSDILTEQLEQSGVDIQFYTEAVQARRPEGMDQGLGMIKGGPITVRTASASIEADELLLATGQRPALDSINLASVGLSVDDVLEERTPDWLHALGDAGGKHQLTHMGKYQSRQFAARFIHSAEAPDADNTDTEPPTPQVVFTDPQIAFVGLSEEAAREAGYDVITAEANFADVAGAALLRDDVVGRAKIVVDTATDCLIGATLMGPETAEMLHAATIAITADVPVSILQHAVPAFPTASEVWLGLLQQVADSAAR
ncbi:MAG: NAD(P)/FAD-dependent oxidoreductase [Micrococcaceae bacterium]|nr:NAD(P)/FAD-dependent oxidoreductase [Micrococcaceae bacterium]